MTFKVIKIDAAAAKTLQERTGPGLSFNAALRKLLGLPPLKRGGWRPRKNKKGKQDKVTV